jgi:hypothetical protein
MKAVLIVQAAAKGSFLSEKMILKDKETFRVKKRRIILLAFLFCKVLKIMFAHEYFVGIYIYRKPTNTRTNKKQNM